MPNNNLFNSSSPLLPQLRFSILKSVRINIIMAFILESGVKLLINELKQAVKENNDVKIRILTGVYLNVTEPNALYLLKTELGDNLDIRIYKNFNRSFHPKTYIFEYKNGKSEVIIGSSNISKTALINGIEWNYKTNSNTDEILSEFNKLYETESIPASIEFLRNYHKSWKKTIFTEKTIISQKSIEPINFQIPALYELNQTREEGYKKAMVIAATGLGKTYLTAFDSMGFKRVLFVAHREEILIQSEKSYKKVNKNMITGFFTGNKKEKDSDVIFATVQTLGKDKYLNENYFKKDYFDYIIIDEFHHAAADSYKRIIKYFTPQFLLGLTATPYRTDNKDIYKLCDYNVAYECNLKTAINNSWLVPFKYFGFFDDIDYDEIPWRNGKYDLHKLESAIMISKRTQNIIQKYNSYHTGKTIAFCVSIKHADYMAKKFNDYKIKSLSLHSGVNKKERKNIINEFEFGKISVLFVVDIFNEGIDIPNIETVMFLRPTESYTIFMQQLGRGLRLAPDKEFLTVLDFVGNYKGADFKYSFLMGDFNPESDKPKILPTEKDYELPDNCQTYFDFELIDLFKELKKNEPIKERLKAEYLRIKNDIGYTPSVMDIFEQSTYPFNLYRRKFGSYLSFRKTTGDLTETEKSWFDDCKIISEFLAEIEKTSMTKSYKIPVLMSLIKDNLTTHEVTLSEISLNFKNFYSQSRVHQKDLNNKSNKNWKNWTTENFGKLALKQPIKHLSSGAMAKYFNYDTENKLFSLNNELFNCINKHNKEFTTALENRLKYRKLDYFRRKFES